MADLAFAIRPAAPCQATLCFEAALARMESMAVPLGRERVPLGRAAGRVLAEPVRARIDSPRVCVAAMDGYAVRCGAAGSLRIVGDASPARPYCGELGARQAVRILTGAPMPDGGERVVVQELAARYGDRVTVPAPEGRRHVRPRGSDFAAADILLPEGRRLDPRALLVAAAADAAEVTVWRRPRLFVLATGDELARPGSAYGSALVIPDSTSLAIAALATEWGAEVAGLALVPDQPAAIAHCARAAMAAADVIVMTGGASVGDRDFSKTALASLGLELVFSKVAIKPGKPVWYGRAGDGHILGLPGNPTAALVTARLFLAPLICRLTGRPISAALSWRPAPLSAALDKGTDRETFLCGEWDGATVRALGRQAASSQAPLAHANILIRRGAGTPAGRVGDDATIVDF